MEKAISLMLKQVMTDPESSITDRMKVIDRSIKLEALKAKMSDADWGSGFLNEDEDE